MTLSLMFGTRRIFTLLLFALLGLTGARLGAGDSREAGDLTIVWEDLWENASTGYTPEVFRVINRGPEHLLGIRVSGRSSYYNNSTEVVAERSVRVGAGEEILVEIPRLISSDYYGVLAAAVTVDGSRVSELAFSGRSESYPEENSRAVIFLCPGWTAFQQAIEASLESKDPAVAPPNPKNGGIEASDVAPELACRYWQSYFGLKGVVVMNRSTLPRLTPEQREALKTWVRVGGGTLWIADAGWKEVVQSMGFRSINDSENEDFTGLRWRTEGFGRLLLSDGELIKTITFAEFILALPNHFDNALHYSFSSPRAEEHRLHRSYRYHGDNADGISLPETARMMIGTLVEIPVIGYLICSLGLAVLIGPVNLLWLKRRRRTILFCFTAPLIALAGILVLMLYSVLSEGLGVKLRERAVLWHDLDQGDGMIYQERAFYSGLSRGELTYPATSLVSAWRSSSAPISLSYQMDSRLTLLSGWIPSRTPAGIFTLTPIRPRLGLEVVHRQGSLYLVNHLDHTVLEAWVTNNGSRYRLADLAPGGEKVLTEEEESSKPTVELFSLCPGDITARMAGLPYQEDGGVTGEVLGGEYWYLATRNREAPLSKGKGALPKGSGGRRR